MIARWEHTCKQLSVTLGALLCHYSDSGPDTTPRSHVYNTKSEIPAIPELDCLHRDSHTQNDTDKHVLIGVKPSQTDYKPQTESSGLSYRTTFFKYLECDKR